MSLEETEGKLLVGETEGELRLTPTAERDKRIDLLEQRLSRLEAALSLNGKAAWR